jgi:integrase
MKVSLIVAPLVTDEVISGTHQPKIPHIDIATLPKRDGNVSISSLIDSYMLSYCGKDQSRSQRMRWWQNKIGHLSLNEVEDDNIFFAMEELAKQNGRYFAGLDVDGNKIFKSKGKKLSPATLNRYVANIGALFTWAIKQRIAPKGFIHPCRGIARKAENNERIRFLSASEMPRLLDATKQSSWEKLYLLVLLGLTTGARKGELLKLCWSNIDVDKKVAYTGITKNGDRKAIPLLPNVLAELNRYISQPNHLVFCSPKIPTKKYCFESRWQIALKEARINDFHFHDLRHSCASYLVQNNATLVEVGDVLGHRDLRTTRRYAHLGVEHKANLVNRVLGHIA